jgi:hypothetical protein
VLGVLMFALVLVLLDNRRFPAAWRHSPSGSRSASSAAGSPRERNARPDELRLVLPRPLTSAPPPSCSCCRRSADDRQRLSGPPRPRPASSPATGASIGPGRASPSMGIANIPPGCSAPSRCATAPAARVRTTASAPAPARPIFLGLVLIAMALGFSQLGFALLASIPNAVLGVLLVFAGLELCPLVRSLKTNEEYFVALVIAGIALAVPNMAWAFGAGILIDIVIRKARDHI